MNIKNVASEYKQNLIKAIEQISEDEVQAIFDQLMQAYENGKTIFVIGNGGSASTASHVMCDWGKGTVKDLQNPDAKRFRVISLTDNMALLTAIGNDLSYEDTFSQPLHNLLQPGDLVVVITASGNSPNIIKALEFAKSRQAITIGFLGFHTGGKAKPLCDYSVVAQSDSYGISEDLHLILNHLLTECLKTKP